MAFDFWLCSCCGQFIDGADEQPAYTFPNGDFQCSICVFLDAERDALELCFVADEGTANG